MRKEMRIFDGYKESVKKLLTAAENDLEIAKHIYGTIADIITVEKGYRVAIGAAVGVSVHNIITPTIENATVIAKKYPNRFKIVTLDGDIIATNGLLTGGESQRRFGVYFADEDEIMDIDERLMRALKQTMENGTYPYGKANA